MHSVRFQCLWSCSQRRLEFWLICLVYFTYAFHLCFHYGSSVNVRSNSAQVLTGSCCRRRPGQSEKREPSSQCSELNLKTFCCRWRSSFSISIASNIQQSRTREEKRDFCLLRVWNFMPPKKLQMRLIDPGDLHHGSLPNDRQRFVGCRAGFKEISRKL